MDRPRRTSRRVIPDITHHPSPSPDPSSAIPQKRIRTPSPSPVKPKRGRKGGRSTKGKGKTKVTEADNDDDDDDPVISDLITVNDGIESAKKRKRGRARQPTPPEFEIPPEPARRSGRNRAPPKDPYIEGLVATAATKKTAKPRGPPKPKKKKMTAEELWAPENLVTKNSPYITADLTVIPLPPSPCIPNTL